MDTEGNIYFEKGKYIFGSDDFSSKELDSKNCIIIDRYQHQALGAEFEYALVFVERDKKQGILSIEAAGMGGYGKLIYSSNIYPLIYDEILFNGSSNGNNIGYAVVRINHYWGVLRLEDQFHYLRKKKCARRPCMMIIPCIYSTKEQAIAQIQYGPDFHPEYGWRDPFVEQVR